MRAHTKFLSVYYLSWVVQDTIIELGMICACILALYQISNGAPIGNFVMLVAYWGNFTGEPFASRHVALANTIQVNLPLSPKFRAK